MDAPPLKPPVATGGPLGCWLLRRSSITIYVAVPTFPPEKDVMGPTPPGYHGMTRRGFLVGSGLGLAAGVGGSAAWHRWLNARAGRGNPAAVRSFTGTSREVARPEFAMPGRFPGRVVEVRHPGSVTADHHIRPEAVKAMMDRGMV